MGWRVAGREYRFLYRSSDLDDAKVLAKTAPAARLLPPDGRPPGLLGMDAGRRAPACPLDAGEAGRSVCTQPRLKGYYYKYLFKEVRCGPGDFAAQPRFSPSARSAETPAGQLPRTRADGHVGLGAKPGRHRSSATDVKPMTYAMAGSAFNESHNRSLLCARPSLKHRREGRAA
jgi:hypothetical protein